MLSAVEAPAEQGAAIIKRAPRGTEINAMTIRVGGEQKHGIPRCLISQNAMAVGFHAIALLRVEKQGLTAPAALDTPIAAYLGVLV